jgi:hypothetical protein
MPGFSYVCATFLILLVRVWGVAAANSRYVWIEAESSAEKRENSNDWYDPVDRQTSLSGNDWWHSFDEPHMDSGYVVCTAQAPATDAYRLWIRLNLTSSGYLYAVDDQALQELPVQQWRASDKEHEWDIHHERRIFDEAVVSHDGSNRHKLVWVKGPMLSLREGPHRFTFKVSPGDDGKGFAAVDCFVLAGEAFEFRPRLFYRPEQQVQVAPEIDTRRAWTFPHHQRDTFAPSPLDLRRLNETVAGEHGFIRLSQDGESFVRGDGQPIRFWSGSNYSWRIPFSDGNFLVSPQEKEQVAHHARWSAKRGINMVRFHGHLPPKHSNKRDVPAITRESMNEVDLHGAWYMVAAFKQEGIYSTLSPYWGSHTDNEPEWDLGFKGGNLAGLVFFYEPVEQMYRRYLRRLYTEINPYTGTALKDDPAVAVIQLQNEDSLLFYTASRISGRPLEVLTKTFGDFLTRKYGSLERALGRYTSEYESNWDLRGYDDLGKGTVAVLQNWFWTLDAKNRAGRWSDPETRARLDDQLEFFTTLMRDFNARTARYLREELGCRQLINAGNWKSVDPVTADDAERYSYTANEVIARNAYYGCLHAGINTGWQILTQQVYTSWSSLKRPRFWPMNVKQVVGHPFIIPESMWVPPNLYASEGPLVVAGQLSLTGVDSFYWFASGGEEWGAIDGKWSYNQPLTMGQFPTAALAFRQGYIAEATEPVVYEERSLRDIWQQKTPLIAESPVFDINRDEGDMPVESKIRTPQDPLAFCAGPVKVKYGGDASRNRVSARLEELIDESKQTVTSVTGQITTDYGRGVYTVDAPRCQGAAGFLATCQRIQMRDTSIDCDNAYASIVAVPLDDRPLAQSRRILVQVGTVARPQGWTVRKRALESGGEVYDGFQIMRKGGEPLLIEGTQAVWTINNAHVTQARALDINGQPLDTALTVERQGGALHVTLPTHALYTVVSD